MFCLDNLRLVLKINTSTLPVFPSIDRFPYHLRIRINPAGRNCKVPGIINDPGQNWRPHIKSQREKGNCSMPAEEKIQRQVRYEQGCSTLHLSRYLRSVLEFGCGLISGFPNCKLQPLLAEWRALRQCLEVLKYVAISVLHVEANIPHLASRFQLTVRTFS